MSMPAPPPDTRAAGQPGHISDHNEISDALSWLSSAVAALQASTPPPAQRLSPMEVQSASLTAVPGALVPCDVTAGSITVTLPTGSAEATVVGVKVIAVSGGHTVTIATNGSDRINTASGPTSIALSALDAGATLQYSPSFAIWFVIATASL